MNARFYSLHGHSQHQPGAAVPVAPNNDVPSERPVGAAPPKVRPVEAAVAAAVEVPPKPRGKPPGAVFTGARPKKSKFRKLNEDCYRKIKTAQSK